MQDQSEGFEESSEDSDSDSSPVTDPAPARIEYEVLDEDDGGYDE